MSTTETTNYTEILMKRIANKIRELLGNPNTLSPELRKMNIDPASFSRWEYGQAMSFSKFLEICIIFKKPPSFWLEDDDEIYFKNENNKSNVRVLRQTKAPLSQRIMHYRPLNKSHDEWIDTLGIYGNIEELDDEEKLSAARFFQIKRKLVEHQEMWRPVDDEWFNEGEGPPPDPPSYDGEPSGTTRTVNRL